MTIDRSLVIAVFACGTVLACKNDESAPTSPDASAFTLGRKADWEKDVPKHEPAVFAPGVVSTDREEYHITFTPDGRTAYWAVGDEFFPISEQATIVTSTYENGAWSAPQVASFSGQYSDIDPFITPDGSRLFFSSIRPVDGVPRDDADLWIVERTATGWSEPVHLGDAVNSPFEDLYPSVDEDGTLYLGSDRPGGFGGWDIYSSTPAAGSYGPAINLGPTINTEFWEFNPFVTPDGRTLLYTGLSYPQGFGFGDIYVSRQKRGSWTPGENLGPTINTELDEYHPALSPSGKTLFFVRHSYEPWIPGDVYAIKARGS